MTRLRKMMLEELQRPNYAETTIPYAATSAQLKIFLDASIAHQTA
jgi:hypothetical protein